jgi:hypothetical protein
VFALFVITDEVQAVSFSRLGMPDPNQWPVNDAPPAAAGGRTA